MASPNTLKIRTIDDASLRAQHATRCFNAVLDAHSATSIANRLWHPRHPHMKMATKVAKYVAELRDVKLHRLTANAQKLFESLQVL